jgi:hypothetical protein
MTNIIQNGDIYWPTITGFPGESGGVQYYTDFVQFEKEMFVWIGSDSFKRTK